MSIIQQQQVVQQNNKLLDSTNSPTSSTASNYTFGYALLNLTEQDARQVQWQAELKGEDWNGVQTVMTRLFQLRKLELATELVLMNERLLKLSKSNIGPFLGEFYQDHLLKKCMIILRQDAREETGSVLLERLAQVWVQFYTSILPTLQAFFAPIQFKGLSVRSLTLLSFRDIVVLKTNISEALDSCKDTSSIPPEIKQMLLVLQSTHKTPPTSQFFELQSLVSKVVHPYLCMETPPNEDTLTVSGTPQTISSTVKRHHSMGGLHDTTKLIKKGSNCNTPETPGSVKSLPFDQPER